METAVRDTAAQPVRFVERRRAGSVPPRGMVFVERRRPAPVLVVDVEDLHDGDAQRVLGDALDFGFGTPGLDPTVVVAELAGLIRADAPAALAAHALRGAA